MIDKHYRKMPRNSEGSIKAVDPSYNDNDIDALRHSYVSAVYVIEFSENTAELLGRLNEYLIMNKSELHSLNIDLWNNSVGRSYGKRFKRGEELFFALLKAQKDGALIIAPSDPRKYKGLTSIKRLPKSFVNKVKEFFDVHKKLLMSKEQFVEAIQAGRYPGYAVKKHYSGEYPYSTRDRFSFNNLG